MSSYLSNLLTSTTDKYNSLRRNLLASEGDGDTEDDSHICRVLRAYYTEKSQQLPDWLPPDPKKVVATAMVPQQNPQVGSSYGSLWNTSTPSVVAAAPQQHAAGSRSALSDLWDTPGQGQPQQRASPLSLRGAGRQQGQQTLAAPAVVRPLPSQRAGSYQSQMSALSARTRGETPGGSQGYGAGGGGGAHEQQRYSGGSGTGGGGATAQERLKARLWGQSTGGAGGGSGGGQHSSGGSGGSRWG